MKSYDTSQLAQSLNGLAEAYDRKLLTPKAIEIWYETLKEFPTHLVLGFLGSWPKLHNKFPVPAEVWKLLNDIQTAERERLAANEKAEAQAPVQFSKTPGGRRAMEAIREIIGEPKLSPREHWHKILSTHQPESIGYEYARMALEKLNRGRNDGEMEMAA